MATQNNISQTSLQLINDIDIVKVIDALGFEIIRRRKFTADSSRPQRYKQMLLAKANRTDSGIFGRTMKKMAPESTLWHVMALEGMIRPVVIAYLCTVENASNNLSERYERVMRQL